MAYALRRPAVRSLITLSVTDPQFTVRYGDPAPTVLSSRKVSTPFSFDLAPISLPLQDPSTMVQATTEQEQCDR